MSERPIAQAAGAAGLREHLGGILGSALCGSRSLRRQGHKLPAGHLLCLYGMVGSVNCIQHGLIARLRLSGTG